MIKIEVVLSGESDVDIQWVDRPSIEEMENSTNEEWDRHAVVWDKISNGIHSLLGELGSIPPEGWNVKFWADASKLPKSVTEKPDVEKLPSGEGKPEKLVPHDAMHWFHTCMSYIEKKYHIATDKRTPRTDSLWLWLKDQEGEFPQRQSAYFLTTNPTSPNFSYLFEKASPHILKVLELIHREFADHPDDEGITFWIE